MHYYGYHAMSGWGYALMTVSTLTLVALLVVGLVLLVRYAGQSTPPAARPQPQSPEDILDQRLARGEIDTQEYETRLVTLRGARSQGGSR